MICEFCCCQLGPHDENTWEGRKADHLGKCPEYREWKNSQGLMKWMQGDG